MENWDQSTPIATDTLLVEHGDPVTGNGRQNTPYQDKSSSDSSLCSIVLTSYEDSEDLMTFISHVFSSTSQTVFGYALCLTSFIVALLALVLGILRYGACPCEPCVPMFLAVGGCALMLRSICHGLRGCCSRRKPCDESEPDVLQTLHSILGILVLFWTIPGIVWIFGIIHKVDTSDAESTDYCDNLLYWFTVAFLGVIFLVLLLQLSLLIALCIVHNYLYSHMEYSNFEYDDNDDINEVLDEHVSSERAV